HPGQPRLGRRALRADLRDQHEPLHLLRLLRARLPVRRDHARQRLRALRVPPRRPDLHEGDAPRPADQADPGRRGRDLRHPRAGLEDRQLMEETFVWIVWLVATTALFASGFAVVMFQNPFYSALSLIVNLASLAV